MSEDPKKPEPQEATPKAPTPLALNWQKWSYKLRWRGEERAEWADINCFNWHKGRHRTEYKPGQFRTDWEAYYPILEGRSEGDIGILKQLLHNRNVKFEVGNTQDIDLSLGNHPTLIVNRDKMLMAGHVTITPDPTMVVDYHVHQCDGVQAAKPEGRHTRASASRVLGRAADAHAAVATAGATTVVATAPARMVETGPETTDELPGAGSGQMLHTAGTAARDQHDAPNKPAVH